jgi:hypothetical protein
MVFHYVRRFRPTYHHIVDPTNTVPYNLRTAARRAAGFYSASRYRGPNLDPQAHTFLRGTSAWGRMRRRARERMDRRRIAYFRRIPYNDGL